MRPFFDNFDFDSNNIFAMFANPTVEDAIDPSKIGRTVKLSFTGDVATQTYTAATYANEQALINSWGDLMGSS
jgi:hypothetical protein